MTRIRTTEELLWLIKQFRRGMTQKGTVIDYYRNLCDSRKIYELLDEFNTAITFLDEDKIKEWVDKNVENAISYYD